MEFFNSYLYFPGKAYRRVFHLDRTTFEKSQGEVDYSKGSPYVSYFATVICR